VVTGEVYFVFKHTDKKPVNVELINGHSLILTQPALQQEKFLSKCYETVCTHKQKTHRVNYEVGLAGGGDVANVFTEKHNTEK